MHPADQQILDNIAEYGWHVTLVPDEPSFGYTIGIHKTFGKPELFICGLIPDDIHYCCNQYGQDIREGKVYRESDSVHHWFGDGQVQMVFLDVHDGWKPFYLGKLVDLMGEPSVPVLQGIWSDDKGLFPPMEGFDPALAGKQFFLNGAPEY